MPKTTFQDHLDMCDQCRNQPFNLCPIGMRELHTHDQSRCETGVDLVSNPMRSFEDSFADVFGTALS